MAMEKTTFGQGISDYGKTEPVGGGFSPDFSATAGVSDWNAGPTAGAIPTMDAPNGSGFTLPTGPEQHSEEFRFEQAGATEPVTPNDIYGFMPVVGWLVCVEGVDRGRDYRIHSGYNTIGRESSNDICITGDNKISREKQALIAFDSQECLFFIAPGDGKNLIRVNNRVLMVPTELHAQDTISIGNTKLMFIPLCSETFTWEKG